jgi:diacylglycerol kinase (ATP)
MKKEFIIKENQGHTFSLRARLKSFRYAFEGLNAFFNTQHNALIHLLMTVLVFIASVFYAINKTEAIAVILATGFVWAAELFNTAIEKLADMVSGEFHPSIKFIKDVSAAAVLLAATTAFVTGAIVFLPKILA